MEEDKFTTVINVIKRDDYKRLTKELKTKAEALAEIIRKKMELLENYVIHIDNVMYGVVSEELDNYNTNYNYLAVIKKGGNFYNLEDIGNKYFFDDDTYYIGATNEDAIQFINSIDKLIHVLGEIEEEQVNKVNKALAIADNIISNN